MSVSINWESRVINVPRNDLTLIQSTPVEIRELSLNAFRLDLKNLEDGEDGIAYPDTHSHNTEVLLGGIVYARVIEIINGYTITFENGQYAVNLVGANSNVGDVVNVNQVSIRSSNSAGLISNQAIEFSSFANAVTIDVDNLTGLATNGTVFPTGTRQAPSNNLTDLYLISQRRGLNTVNVIGNLVLSDEADWNRYYFKGESAAKTVITLNTEATVSNCEFYDAVITGHLDGNSQIERSVLSNLTFVDGFIFNCALGPSDIFINSGATANIFDCFSTVPGESTPSIDLGGSGILALRGYKGGIRLKNYNSFGSHSIDLDSGQVKLDSSFVSGKLIVRGVGKLIDSYTGEHIFSGIYNSGATSGVTIVNELLNVETIANSVTGSTFSGDSKEIAISVWDYLTSSGNTNGSFGLLLNELVSKSDDIQHTGNLNTELLKNKPNNP